MPSLYIPHPATSTKYPHCSPLPNGSANKEQARRPRAFSPPQQVTTQPNTIHQTYPALTMKNQKKNRQTPRKKPHPATRPHKQHKRGGEGRQAPGSRGRKTNTAANPIPRRACSTHRIQLTDPPPHRHELQYAARLCENTSATQSKTPKSHLQGHAGSHDKNTDPTTTPAPAQREAIAVPARPTIRAPVLPPASVCEIRPPTRRNTKDPSCLHDSALPERQAMHRRKRCG